MEPWAAALLVVLLGLTASVIGITIMASARFGSFGGTHMVSGLVVLLYGAWALLAGGILMVLSRSGASILVVGVILGVVGLAMYAVYPWVVEGAKGLLSQSSEEEE